MVEIKLSAKKRNVVGKKVKTLRQAGQIPANIYGKKIKSQALSLDKKDFEKVFAQAGETGIVKVTIEGEKEERPTLIQNVQKHPVSSDYLHIDLRQIILTEKITANIPVEMAGISPAASQKLGILIQNVSEIEVEALPLDLPEKFIVDVSKLANVGDQITVAEVAFDRSKVEVKTDSELVVAKIEPLAAEEVAPAPVEAATAEGEAVPAEGGQAPAEAPKEEKKEEEKKE